VAADRRRSGSRGPSLLAGALLLAGCAVGGTPVTATPPVSTTDLAALRASVDEINRAAGDPTTQRRVLEQLVLPAKAAEQRHCPPTANTVTLEPAWPSVSPRAGTPGAYLLPTLLRVHTDGRITGTDLTALVFTVQSGRARTSTLCVS
jgi:hypothetical protein